MSPRRALRAAAARTAAAEAEPAEAEALPGRGRSRGGDGDACRRAVPPQRPVLLNVHRIHICTPYRELSKYAHDISLSYVQDPRRCRRDGSHDVRLRRRRHDARCTCGASRRRSRRVGGQWRKWRRRSRPSRRPAASAAATTSSSRTEPPGWMIARDARVDRELGPSANGKNASEASAEPASSSGWNVARLLDRDPHRVHAAHLPGADPDRRAAGGDHDRVRAHVAADRPGEQQVLPLLLARLPALVSTRICSRVSVTTSRVCTSWPPITGLPSTSCGGAGQSRELEQAHVLLLAAAPPAPRRRSRARAAPR